MEKDNKDKRRLIIIDGNALVHRAFHALPPLTRKNGELVNAVYGFLLVFLKAIKEFRPYYVVATFDFPAPSFRKKEYKLYKANRVKAPDELYNQIPKVKEILSAFNIQIIEKEGFEADDLIGTISKTAPKKQIFPPIESIILSGDRDVLQLVDKNTKAFILRKGVKDVVLFDEKEVQEKYGGLLPDQLVDFKSLRGDPADNIPGVFGIGEKTAIALIQKFGSVKNLYDELETNGEGIREVKIPLREKLRNYKTQAEVSKMLAEIKKDVEIDFDLERCKWGEFTKSEVDKAFLDYGFKVLLDRFWDIENGNDVGKEDKKEEKKKKVSKKNKKENTLKLI